MKNTMDLKMNFSLVSQFFLVLIIVGITAGIYPPRLVDVPQDHLVVQSGDNFKLRCEAPQPINWTYPMYANDSKGSSVININNTISEDINYPYISILELVDAYFMDTGYYSCFFEGTEDIQNSDSVSKIYVFVSDPVNLLVREDNFVMAYEHKPAYIPCRPTSPEVEVNLFNDYDEDLVVLEPKRITFTPQQGFKIDFIALEDSLTYSCHAKLGDMFNMTSTFLHVLTSTDSVPAPSIQLDTSNIQGHVQIGSKFVLTCSVSVPRDIKFRLNWDIPNIRAQQSGRLLISNTTSASAESTSSDIIGIRQIVVTNAQVEDKGSYKCTILDHNGNQNSASYSITVFDKEVGYINVTENDDSSIDINADVGNSAKSVVKFKAYPAPTALWLDPYGRNIDSVPRKFKVETTVNQTVLHIFNVTYAEAGEYILELDNNIDKQYIRRYLHVEGAPQIVNISRADGSVMEYYNPNKSNYTLVCTVLSNPRPNKIKWSFKKCSTFTDCSANEIKLIGSSPKNGTSLYELTSEVILFTNESGIVSCKAENKIGAAKNETTKFIISDMLQDYYFENNPDEAVIGYPFKLTCRVSKFKYTNFIAWSKGDELLTSNSDGITITNNETNYSFVSSLSFSKITQDSAGEYKCMLRDHQDYPIPLHMNLEPKNPEKPKLFDTNLNNSAITISRENIHTLRCYASGVPKPTVTWYKDDEPLVLTNRTILSPDRSTLTLQYLGMEDQGRYQCNLNSVVGTAHRYMDITVKGKMPINAGMIALIVVMSVILFALLILLAIKIRKERKLKYELTCAGLNHFETGAAESINPELGVDEQADLLPYDRKWEFPRDKLKLGKQLGSGAFGVVMKAEAIGIIPGEPISIVAVKMVKRNADSTYIKALASELKIMVHLGQHLNVVNLLGACTKNLMKKELFVIVEYCCFGNLQNYLLRHRQSFIDQVVNDKIDPTRGSEQIAKALAEHRKAAEAHEEALRVNYTKLAFQNSDDCSSPPPPELSARHPSVSSNPSTYQWNTANTMSTDASGPVNSGGTNEDNLNSNNQPGWRSNYKGDYKRSHQMPICTQDLLCWAFQVARGMDYLVSRKVLHGDLAARNILLAEDNVVKICDFGLAKSMYKSDNYKKKGDGPLPVKWMAIESIQDRVFSTQSDVWSFGIVLWEFFSMARTPYPGMDADEKLFTKIMDGYRMEKPPYATSSIYHVMLDCWQFKPSRRPSFTSLGDQLGTMLEESVRQHYMDLNSPYQAMNNQDMVVEDYLAMMSAPTYCNEVAKQKTPQPEYVNMPQADDASDYLAMSPKTPDAESPLTDEGGYLRMNIGSPTRSVLFSPTSQPLAFQFPSTAKLSPTDKQNADAKELKPMLTINTSPNYNNLPNNSHQENESNPSSAYTNVPNISNAVDDDKFGDGLRTNFSPSFDNPSYQMLGHDALIRKRGYSEASSSGFHSERDSLGHSPKQDDDTDSRASPPHYQEATEMTNSVLV